ncbi:nucleotide sugar dehydrogenase [Mucilaginibacter auburnensis]|uniref:UDP-N-acetyl-D-galactosamine dehydrogenase n=1 Tax=Mucilaginibacter auburnensis TaxID=1457233 RepID=A0A2H9VTC4_9SPHI|nr:nucleotide sugar dehydrogenase [Mucilaginibacter auburnensis]PJJ84070.1 UDP-N-acetyl-D-galactosamine dehydrogenase [Mucilaginibacter auburnensis]
MLGKQTAQNTNLFKQPDNVRIAVIGLGYVGLPLAVEFSKKYQVVGFDKKDDRITELKQGFDRTLEVEQESLASVISSAETFSGLIFSANENDIKSCNVYIICVPTPTDKHNRPDLGLLKDASKLVGSILKTGDVVIYESTVFPGATEEVCIPILESTAKLIFNKQFFVGYSPERINPGDKIHTLVNILKITSGSTPEAADFIDELYRSIVVAGTHKAPSIKVAEAAKVIENSQRDINIAFVNELAKIFALLEIDTQAVLQAAGTKWNFLPFKPGLVGGHCTGVDPYYLAQRAQEAGYHPEIILAGRRLNDGMGTHVALEVIKLMVKKELPVKGADVLVLGFTFKENCPDVRNTRVIDIIKQFADFEANYQVLDPWADPDEVMGEYNIKTEKSFDNLKGKFDAIILAVPHNEFLNVDFDALKKSPKSVLYDIKGLLDKQLVDGRL